MIPWATSTAQKNYVPKSHFTLKCCEKVKQLYPSQSPDFEVKQQQQTIPTSPGTFRYSEKWQEFQKYDSPTRVELTKHPIIFGPYTTLEQFKYEIFKKVNNFKIHPNQHDIKVSHNL